MIRLTLLLALLLLAAAVAAWLADHPGSAVLEFQGFEISTSFAALALLAGLLIALAAGVTWLVLLLQRELPIVGSNRAMRRQKQGLGLVNQALVALAAGDHKRADALIRQAELLLPPQAVVHLIGAEAALRSGDHAMAATRFRALEASDEGRLLGLRGLVGDARRRGALNEALTLTRTAFREQAHSPWVLQTLFELEVESGDFAAAQKTLDRVARDKLLDTDQIARHRGALLYAAGASADIAGDRAAALQNFRKATKARPNFAPAIAATARLEREGGEAGRAAKTLMTAWARGPHPLLARAWKALDTAESGADWQIRAERLAAQKPGHVESYLLLADAALDARQPEAAEPIIQRLSEQLSDRRLWALKLRLATALGRSTDAAEEALESAQNPPGWVCSRCMTPASHWVTLCARCNGFDTLVWGHSDTVGALAAAAVTAPLLLPDATPGAAP